MAAAVRQLRSKAFEGTRSSNGTAKVESRTSLDEAPYSFVRNIVDNYFLSPDDEHTLSEARLWMDQPAGNNTKSSHTTHKSVQAVIKNNHD